MDVAQENSNQEEGKGNDGVDSGNNAGGSKEPSSSSLPSGTANSESKSEKSPIQQLRAEVDMSKKPETLKEPINLLDDSQLDAQVTKPTDEDVKRDDKKPASNPDVNKLRDTISSTTPNPSPVIDRDKRRKKAEKWARIIDMAIIFGLRQWSGQADDAGLDVQKSDKEAMADAIEDVMIEYNVATNPVVEGLSTLVAVYSTPFKNAQKSRRLLQEFKKTEAYKKAKEEELVRQANLKPKLDLFSGKHIKPKGGQRKA